jgi:hypothetical protein
VRILPLPVCARRMAILITVVAAIDVSPVFLTEKPLLWCAIIPALIPILTPAVIFSRDVQPKD